jgi:hypothetical protein
MAENAIAVIQLKSQAKLDLGRHWSAFVLERDAEAQR